MIIVLSWREWLLDPRVAKLADLAAAEAYVDAMPADRAAFAVDTDVDGWCELLLVWQQQYTNTQLAQIHAALGGEGAPKGTDAAVRKIESRILQIARDSDFTKSAAPLSMDGDATETKDIEMADFKPVRRDSAFGKVLGAYFEFEDLTVGDIAAQTGLAADKVAGALRAGKGSGFAYTVDKETKVVAIDMPAGVDATNAFWAPKEKPAKEPREREYKVGEFKRVRRGSGLGKLVAAAQAGGSMAAVAAAAGLSEDDALAALKSLRRTHGMDHTIVDGEVVLDVPGGDPFVAEAKRKPAAKGGAPRRTKSTELDELAATGVMPEKPIVTSETNAHRQKHFDQLAAAAAEGRWADVEAKQMNGIDTYSKAINRYRDRLLAAHRAQQPPQAAE